MLWIKFFIAAAIIVFAGVKLARYADGIALRTGISRGFIGVLALAFITSLPE
jgi:cation:H+ antiporter